MNSIDALNHPVVGVAVAAVLILIAFWLLKKLMRWALLLLIVGFLIWRYWLS